MIRRRTPVALAVLTAAAVLAATTPANAAWGVLKVNGMSFQNPVGCIRNLGALGTIPQPLRIDNGTTMNVEVFLGANCDGPAAGVVRSDEEGMPVGASVFVP